MNKEKFILRLSIRLKDLSDEDINKTCEFYSEMISDRMEEGLSEEEAVEALGSLDYIESEIRRAIREEASLPIIAANVEPEAIEVKNEPRGYQLALLIIGFPLWFPLIISALAVALALYVVIWGLAIGFIALDIALVASGISLLVGGIGLLFTASFTPAILNLAFGVLLIGLSLVLFIGLRYIIRLAISLTVRLSGFLGRVLLGGRRNA